MSELVDEVGSAPEVAPPYQAVQSLDARGLKIPQELHETLQIILENLSALVSFDACAILLLNDGHLFIAASQNLPSPDHIEQIELTRSEQLNLAQAIAVGPPVLAPAGSLPPAFGKLETLWASGTTLYLPLQHLGHALGLLAMYTRGYGILTRKDARVSMAFASQAALAIDNARLYAETRQRALQLEVANHISQKVASILDLDDLLTEMVSLIHSKFGYYHVHIFLVESQTQEIVLQELSGEEDGLLRKQGMRIKIGDQGITSWVAQQGRPLRSNDVSQESRYYPHELLPRTRSEMAIPMRVGDMVVGVLDIQSEQLNAFEEDDVTAFQILADQVAIAIENIRLFRETRRQLEFLSALHQISLEITSKLDTEQVLNTILRQATRFLKAEGSVLALYDPVKDVLPIIVGYNVAPSIIGVELEIGEGVAGQVMATERPVFSNDYHTWQNRSHKFKGDPFSAVLGAPLRRQSQVIGALVVLDQSEVRPFTQEDAQLLTLFANLASIAIVNSEQYATIQKARRRLEQKAIRRKQELSQTRQTLARTTEQLRNLLRATVNIQEEERARIALDLHDGSNQLVTGILYEIQAAQQSIHNQRNEQSLEKLETAKQLLRQIEAENHRIIAGLRPPLLDSEGLLAALREHLEIFQRQYGIQCQFRVAGSPMRLPPEAEMAIYRILQEALNNVADHAQATNVNVLVKFQPGEFFLSISDDGIGFNPEADSTAAASHIGLIGMRERAESIGGNLNAQSKQGMGTRISLKIPLPAPHAPDDQGQAFL